MNQSDTQSVRDKLASDHGIHFAHEDICFVDNPQWGKNINLAMDAQPILQTPSNAGIPAFLTSAIYPEAINIVTAPNKASEMMGDDGEKSVGEYPLKVIILTNVEETGAVSAYSDYSNNGKSGSNFSFDNYQVFGAQSLINYGDEELKIAGLAKLDAVGNKQRAAAAALAKWMNLSWFNGVAGLQNYGLLNTPGLAASIVPAPKGWGGVGWFNNGVVQANYLEIYNDLLALIARGISQCAGNASNDSKMRLGMSPLAKSALMQVSQYGKTVMETLQVSYPNLKIVDAVQYGALSATNTQGNAGGEVLQLVFTEIDGVQTGFCGYTSKLIAGRVIAHTSSFEQKYSNHTAGALIRRPFAVVSMIGV